MDIGKLPLSDKESFKRYSTQSLKDFLCYLEAKESLSDIENDSLVLIKEVLRER